jgi:hypothetical protein
MDYSKTTDYRTLKINPRIGEWSFLGYNTKTLIKKPYEMILKIVKQFLKPTLNNLEKRISDN